MSGELEPRPVELLAEGAQALLLLAEPQVQRPPARQALTQSELEDCVSRVLQPVGCGPSTKAARAGGHRL